MVAVHEVAPVLLLLTTPFHSLETLIPREIGPINNNAYTIQSDPNKFELWVELWIWIRI